MLLVIIFIPNLTLKHSYYNYPKTFEVISLFTHIFLYNQNIQINTIINFLLKIYLNFYNFLFGFYKLFLFQKNLFLSHVVYFLPLKGFILILYSLTLNHLFLESKQSHLLQILMMILYYPCYLIRLNYLKDELIYGSQMEKNHLHLILLFNQIHFNIKIILDFLEQPQKKFNFVSLLHYLTFQN